MSKSETNTYPLTKYEQETIVNFNEDEKVAYIYTYNKRWMKKLDNLCLKFPDKFIFEREDWYGKFLSKRYIIDKNYIGIITPRQYSAEHKQSLKNILISARNKKLNIAK